MKKRRVILLIYGEGGHRSQMEKLYLKFREHQSSHQNKIFLGMYENTDAISDLNHFYFYPMRDKHSHIKTMRNIFLNIFLSLRYAWKIHRNYHVVGVVSTGPGIAIPPSLILRLMGRRVVFIETWSRFKTHSLTGRVMYKIAHRFYIQNEELLKLYPKAIYAGLL